MPRAQPRQPPASLRPAPATARTGGSAPRRQLYVHVAGAVRRPGLIRVPPDTRVASALEHAGGPTARADLTLVNLAAKVQDGQQILVPVKGAARRRSGGAAATGAAAPPGAKIHLSSATAEQLDEVDGIGPTLAERIVEYRDAHGGFRSIDELARWTASARSGWPRCATRCSREERHTRAALRPRRARVRHRRAPFHVVAGGLAAGLPTSTASPAVTLAAAAAVAAAVLITTVVGIVSFPPRSPPVASLAVALVLAGCRSRRGAAASAGRTASTQIREPSLSRRCGSISSHCRAPTPSERRRRSASRRAALKDTRLLMRVARWTRLPRGVEVGAELAVDGHVRPLRTGRTARAGSAFTEQLRRAASRASSCSTTRGRPGGGAAGSPALLDRMRERAERARRPPGSPARRPRWPAAWCSARTSEIDETTRAGLARLRSQPPARGERPERDAARGAGPAAADAGAARPARARLAARSALIALYVPLAGAGPSLQRAGVMGAAGIAAMTLSRPASRWYALLLAAAATLALNPRVSADPGWQLSFAAVAGILARAARWRPRSRERARS